MPFYLFHLFTHFLPVYAVYVLLAERALRDSFLVSVLIAVWCATVVVLEVPSGALADHWSRKGMVVVAAAAKLAACVLWAVARGVWAFIPAFVLWGVAESFASGAVEALLHETLSARGEEGRYEQVSGRCHLLTTAGIAVAIFAGGVLEKEHLPFVFVLSMVFAAAALAAASFFPAGEKVVGEPERYRDILKGALRQIAASRLLLRLVVYCILYLTVVGTIEEFLQLWLAERRVTGFAYGGMFSLLALAQTAGAGLAAVITAGRHMERFLYAGMAASGLLLGGVWLVPGAGFVLMLLVFVLTGLMEVKLEAAAQSAIAGQRATVLSFNSFVMNFTAIFLAMGIGALGKAASFSAAFALSGVVVLLGAGWLVADRGRSANKKSSSS